MRCRVLAGLACAILLTVVACHGETSTGEPTPTSEESTSSQAQALPKYGAPPVPDPLEVSGINDNPCSALNDQQVETFSGTLADTQETQTTYNNDGQACGWIFHGERYSLGTIGGGVILPSSQHQGLSSLYKGEQQGAMDTFREVGPIAGYPAVIYASGRSIGNGFCRLAIGLRDDTAYRVNTELSSDHPAEQNPCSVAKKFAQYIVQNLKEGQS